MGRQSALLRLIGCLACLVVVRAVIVVVLGYRDYFPPDFRSDFLVGREGYFFGLYRWAFYAHLVSGPLALIAGLVLMSESVRQRFPKWHRRLGRAQAVNVLFLVAPSGLWMAWRAPTAVAAAGFATLAVATAVCVVIGWRAAVRRRFTQHRQWMTRSYALLTSAIVIRLIGGAAEVLGTHGTYPYAAWLGWILPLVGAEAWGLFSNRVARG